MGALVLTDRQRVALEFVLRNGRLTIQDYEGLCPGVTRRTLQRDLRALAAKGLLAQEGATNLGVSLYAMGIGLAQPGLGAFVIDRLTPERHGIGMATFAQGLDLGMGLGGVLMGSIATQAGFTPMYLCGSGCRAVALAIFVWGSRTSEAQT
jgi:predicted MFS family arabinose efflux permease